MFQSKIFGRRDDDPYRIRMCENTLLGRQISLEVWIEAGYMYVYIDTGITRWKMSNAQQNHVV